MKYIAIFSTAVLLVLTIYLGLSYLLKIPADEIKKDNNEVSIEFVDIDLENPECQSITRQIKNLINEPQTCETAADCSIAYFGCPFGCVSYVNLTNESAINSLITEQNQVCNTKCRYRCMSDGVKRIPTCINNLCSTTEAIDSATNISDFLDKNSPLRN